MSTNSNMDIDLNPLVLKRSSSAPMINEMNNMILNTPTASDSVREGAILGQFGINRVRRFSASFSPQPYSSQGGSSSPKLTPRVNQLRREESLDVLDREAAHERELHSTMVMSQSWEDLTLVADSKVGSEKNREQLTLSLPHSPISCSTPSPTRSTPTLNRPHFSPSVFKTNLSPSPTRKYTTRSQSPISMRPSPLGPVKRKCCEGEQEEQPPNKRSGGLLIQSSRLDSSFGSVSEGGGQCRALSPLLLSIPPSSGVSRQSGEGGGRVAGDSASSSPLSSQEASDPNDHHMRPLSPKPD